MMKEINRIGSCYGMNGMLGGELYRVSFYVDHVNDKVNIYRLKAGEVVDSREGITIAEGRSYYRDHLSLGWKKV